MLYLAIFIDTVAYNNINEGNNANRYKSIR